MTYNRTAELLTIGAAVITRDGRDLGRVKQVRGDRFKVAAPMQPDYWLSCEHVAAATPYRVELNVDGGALEAAKVDAPEGYGGDADLSSVRPQNAQYTEGPQPATAPIGAQTYQGGTVTGAPAGYGAYKTWDEAAPAFRQSWEAQTGGRRWEDVEPGYRYGWEMARDPRYRDRPWEDAEQALAAGYPNWLQRNGYTAFTYEWSVVRPDVRLAWERSRAGR
jgi:hypothetical protein